MKTTKEKFIINYSLALKMPLLETLIEERLKEIGMPLSGPLRREDLIIWARVDETAYPYALRILGMLFGKIENDKFPTFFQDRVENENAPEVMRLSRIRRGLGVEYGIKDGNEYIDVRYDPKYTDIDCMDLRFYESSGANSLFRVSMGPKGAVKLDYLFQPESEYDFKEFNFNETLQRYLSWSTRLKIQMEKGISPQEAVDYIFDFLSRSIHS